MGEARSRSEAIARGLKRYFTGKPCKHGHIAHRWADGNCVECKKIQIKKYDAKHKKSRYEYFKKWKIENRERMNSHSRLWAKRHPEEHARRARLRRARIRKSSGTHTLNDIKQLLVLQKCKCASCLVGLKDKYDVDHIISLSRGGSNDRHNLQILCVSCNRRKNAKDPLRWAQENGRLL